MYQFHGEAITMLMSRDGRRGAGIACAREG